MEDSFGDLSRIMASRLPRRDVMRLMLGGAISSLLGPLLPSKVYAVVCGFADSPNFACNLIQQCCGVPGARYCCAVGDRCCPNGTTCCANAEHCCDGICCEQAINCCRRAGGITFCCPDDRPCCIDGNCFPLANGQLTASRPGPPAQIDMTVQAEAGIVEISAYKLVNATVDMPYFEIGTTEPVKCTATKVDQTKPSIVELQVCSPAGCCANVDPVLATLRIPEGRIRVRESFSDIPAAEHYVTIQNGHPGLRKLGIIVNGQRAAVLRIGPREVRTIDIPSAMMDPQNIITITAQGRPGASALIVISDVPSANDKAFEDGLRHQPLVAWEPGPWHPDVNMHWGR